MSITETLEIVTPEGQPTIEVRCFVKAPPELLFEVWTKPEHVRKWWGPERLATIECDVDLRVGGRWRCVHQAPDGQTFAFYGEYLAIEPPHTLVRTWIWEGMPDQAAIETVHFEAADGGTVIHGTTTHPTVQARDQHVANGMEEGMRDTFRRMSELVASLVGSPHRSERTGGREASGAPGREQARHCCDDQGGTGAAGPGQGRHHDRPVLGGGVDGDGDRPGFDPAPTPTQTPTPPPNIESRMASERNCTRMCPETAPGHGLDVERVAGRPAHSPG